MSILQNRWDPHYKKAKEKHQFQCFLSRLSIRPFSANVSIWYLLKTSGFPVFYIEKVLYRKTCHRRVNFERNIYKCEKPMFAFYTTLKTHLKTRGFLVFSEDIKWEHLPGMSWKGIHLGNQILNKNKIKFGLHSQMFGCDTIVCSEIPFSKSSCLIETSHLICKVNQLVFIWYEFLLKHISE